MHWSPVRQWNAFPARSAVPGSSVGPECRCYALFENLASGATVEQFLEWFPGVEERQVREVLEYEAKTLKASVLR